MMNFSGSGSYKIGGSGSLSSSSLSPLAPPFKVDKSAQKLNSVNPAVKYPDVPMYGPYFDHTGQFWNPSSSAASAQTESMGITTTCSSSPGIYGYPVLQPSTTGAGTYHVNSGAVDAYDPFSYDPFPNRMSVIVEDGGKPFYSPYVPSAQQKDGYLSPGVGSGHGYDLLSNSSSDHVSGCGSLQVDHSHVRSGVGDGKLNWGRFWGGVNEIEQDKWSGYAQGFGSKDLGLPDSSSNRSPFLLDGSNKSQPSSDVNTHPFTDGSSNIRFPGDGGNRTHLKPDGSFDIFGGTYHLGSLGINQDNMSKLDCSGKLASVPVSISKESCGISEVLEPVADFCGSQKADASSPGDHFSQSGFYVFGCSSTTSTNPATMTKSPFGDSSSFAESTLSALKLNSSRSVAANKSSASAGYDSFSPFETQMSVGWKQQPSVVIRRPVSAMMPSSSKVGERADSQLKGKDASEKIQVTCQRTHQFSSDGFTLEDKDSQAAFSVEKLSGGTDIHNPAEDSPCWRGASKRFSPFEVSEDIAPDVPVKNLVEYKSLSPHEPEIKSLLVDTSDSRDFFFKKVVQSKDNEEKSSATRNPLHFDLNTGGGLQFGYDTDLSTKECCTSNKSKTVSDPGIFLDTRQLYEPVEKSCSSAMSDLTASEGSENCPPVVTEKSSGLLSGIENKCANSTLHDENIVKHLKSSKITDANIDVNVLLRRMTKLSEIFRCYCFNKQAGVQEQYIIATRHIMANLNASLLMMVGETDPNMVSPQGSSSLKELPNAQSVNPAETIAAAAKLVGTAEGLLDFVSVKDDTVADIDMTEASKKILDVNLEEGEEEMGQQKLLYRSLWLEAEASLCVMTAKARFLRLKAKMERTPGGAKDGQGTVGLATMDKDSSMSSDCQKDSAVSQVNHCDIPEYKKCRIPNTPADINSKNFEGPKARKEDIFFTSPDASRPGNTDNVLDGLGSTSHAADVEASVMTRYQILRNRVENSEGTSCDSEQPSGGYNDFSSFCPPASDSHGTKRICELQGAEIPVLPRYQILRKRVENYEGPSCEAEQPSGGYNDSSSFCPSGNDSHGTERICELKGAEIPVMARYEILKGEVDHDSLNDERSRSPGEDNYLPDRESWSPKYQILEGGVDNSDYKTRDSSTADERFQNSQSLSNSVGVTEDGEASVMARFRIIQSCMNNSNSVNKDHTPDQTYGELVEDRSDGVGLSKQQSNVSRYTFGPYPDFAEVEGANQFGFCVDTGALLTQHCKTNRLSPEIFESWYDNDYSSSDWEHISKDDLRKQI